ncbi:polysaccharide biosynthesis endo-1,4-beta-xylanase UppH [Rhizobium sp. RM]|uniref:polysaccharide biosynthesis endo-1,4-beta-xylanase UppH n=1 Tax=Rhizobium sp. RM TaxID=2748079 RepID=UPI00110D36AF|nr:polysaccharide biosynthesis endo-1,4-beta-xylanase UppH [Rhizobium sp. RM]NWJ26917.1 glycosyltransferase [Rhizobium sp. RM]TMV22782.1 glycosyltransferase [Rhizobium sp. Td3]
MVAVSIVIPVRNGERYIVEAIDSVLMQGASICEILVVDDGSTDDTALKVQSFSDARVKLLTRPQGRQGVSAVRNFGLSQARGTWTMFLDADDRLKPDAINALCAGISNDDVVAVYGDYERIDEDGAKIGHRNLIRRREKPSGNVLPALLGGNFIVNGGIMLVRTRIFQDFGGFDETLRYAEDWYGWCRLAAAGSFVYLPGCHILDYRVHRTSVMMNRLLTFKDCEPAVRAVFSDPAIVAAVSPRELARLRHKSETHMNAYIVAQAFRARRYKEAFSALADTFIHRPRQSLRAVIFSAAAIAGI